MFEELDKVVLTHDIREHNLKEGDRGTIVHVYDEGKGYEVEFFDTKGATIAVLTLKPHDLRSYKDRGKHVPVWFNTPISLGTISSMTFTVSEKNTRKGIGELINVVELDTRTVSKDNIGNIYLATI